MSSVGGEGGTGNIVDIAANLLVAAERRTSFCNGEVWVGSCGVSWLRDLHTRAVVQFMGRLALITRIVMT